MNVYSAVQYLLFVVIVTVCVRPLGGYMHRVFVRRRTALDRLCVPVERWIYRLAGVDPTIEMDAGQYLLSFIVFTLIGTLFLYAILRFQRFLPWFFPQYQTTQLSPDLSFNTAISFSTTTTWQAYAGEITMSYFSQMVGLCTQNFLAGAAGLAVGIAFIRGLARESCATLGNFWVDLTRGLLWVLLPGALIGSLLLVWQGVPMNFHHYVVASTLEGTPQVIPQGPVAALEIIKNLGTNGGGFFNANGAHPYENPTPLTNFLELLSIILLPAALTNTFGRMVQHVRQGWLLYWVMLFLFTGGMVGLHLSEQQSNPLIHSVASRGAGSMPSQLQSGGNMEGKEVRFGIVDSALWATVTTDASCGAVNAMHDSFTPLGGLVPLLNMQIGEIIFGGVGSGLYGMLVMAVLSVFIAGLMVGRTPEYLGKKIEGREMKLAMLFVLIFPAVILIPAGAAVVTKAGLAGISNPGPHGFSQILYAFTEASANNGSAFGGLNANTSFYNVTLAFVMLFGRFLMKIPVLALAGSLAAKRVAPPSAGTFPTNGATFVILLIGVILIVAALTFFPADALGPIVEHLAMRQGRLF